MKFFEAVEIARKTGKKIKLDAHIAYWTGTSLRWLSKDDYVESTVGVFDADWQVIEPPPPKQYTFAEAYEMMKAGKIMKPATVYGMCQRFNEGRFEWHDKDEWNEFNFFGTNEIESKWEEVQP